jgi:hypothetical protein
MSILFVLVKFWLAICVKYFIEPHSEGVLETEVNDRAAIAAGKARIRFRDPAG